MPPDDISLAYIYGGLGSTYYRLNQLDSALVYYQKCLDIKKKVQGDYNMDVCEPYKVIALIYRNKLSDYPRALDYYSHAVSIEETVLGSQHNDTQKDYAWMSLSYQQYAQKLLEEEKMDDALLALQRSNAIMTNLTPANTESGKPWKAVNDLTIASILLMKKDFACAYQAYVNAKPMFLEFCQQNIEGAESQYATLLGNLAYSSLFLKKFKEAEKYAREGLAVDSTLHVIASNLAVALLFQDKYEEAEEIYRNYKDELKDGFLDDFEQFAQAGIIPKKCKPELERIKKLLME
jgi:tetratricopeptide (TPR) repeat protein